MIRTKFKFLATGLCGAGLLLSVSLHAQIRLQSVQSQSAQLARRDLGQFPLTDQGNNAFLAALKAGQIRTVATPVESAIVGRYSYSFNKSGSDFLGRPIIIGTAPVLSDGVRLTPRLVGNYYPFAPQQAQNVVLHKRIPTFTTHPSKVIVYPAGLYADMADNELLGRGWTHVAESAKWNTDVYPAQFKRALETAYYEPAANAAATLPDSDPRKAKLLAWSNPPHVLITDDATARLYAKFWVDTFEQPDWKGGGVEYFSVNHEVHQGSYQDYIQHLGLMTRAIIEEAASRGRTLKSGLTDFGNLTHYSPFFFDDPASADPSIPRYMHYSTIEEPFRGSSQASPLGESSIMATLVKQGKAYVGVGSYQQHTWDEQSLFEKNANGTYKLNGSGGLIWRTDERTATILGQQATLYNEDSYKGVLKIYGYFARYYANTFFRAGSKHLPLSTDRVAGWENTKFIRSFRIDAEVETGVNRNDAAALNERPLNPDWVEGDAIGAYLYNDYLRGWMQTQYVTPLANNNYYGSKSRGAVEIYEKGFHRASQLNWIFDTPYQWVLPHLPIKEQGYMGPANPDEQFYRKPIVTGGIATKGGKPTLWLYAWWPCQDIDRYTDVLVWANKNGVQSPAYRIRLKGRKPFLDYWQLPDNLAGLAPKDLYFQFNSLLGEKITWRGDYREAKITSHPTPPAVLESALSGVVVGTSNVVSGGSGSGNGGGGTTCNYTVSASGTGNVNCGGQITLSATASGADASGLTYSWSGNGITQIGQNVSFSAPAANGTYTYTVTATKAGCSKTATATVTVTGCSTAPPPVASTFDYPVPSSSQNWPSYNSDMLNGKQIGEVARMESPYVMLEVRKNYGGAIQITDKSTGRKLVDYVDHGRESEIVVYSGPPNFSVGTGWPNIGWNPITAGDDGRNGSPVQVFAVVTSSNGKPYFYTKTQMLSWPHGRPENAVGAKESRLLECWNERWINLTGKETDIKARITLDRADQTFYPYAQQEYPCFMVPGWDTWNYYYTGNAPYTNAPATRTSTLEQPGLAFQQTNFLVSEPWAAVEYDKAGHYIFANTDKLGKLSTTVYVPHLDNETAEGANATTYSTPVVNLTIDPKGVMYHNYGFYVTSDFNEGRAWANARPRKYGDVPDFKFNQANGRNDWYVDKGTDQREPFTSNGWQCTMVPSKDGSPDLTPQQDPLTARRSSLKSPVGSWKASAMPKLYIRLKYSGSQNQLVLKFRRNGQKEGGIDGSHPNENAARYPNGAADEMTQYFTIDGVVGDGVERTYVVNTVGNPEWKDVIQEFSIRYNFSSSIIPQEQMTLLYFGANNPGN